MKYEGVIGVWGHILQTPTAIIAYCVKIHFLFRNPWLQSQKSIYATGTDTLSVLHFSAYDQVYSIGHLSLPLYMNYWY